MEKDTEQTLIVDERGVVLASCREIASANEENRARGGIGAQGVCKIAADVFGSILTTPGKTVEIVFDKAIQDGLDLGKYEIMKAIGSGDRAIARLSDSKRIVGQGRVLSGGLVRQLGAVSFQLVSIAVAQAHLAEINRNLSEIKSGISELKDHLDNQEFSNLHAIQMYLEHMGDIVKSEEPLDDLIPKKTQMEAIRFELAIWEKKLELEGVQLKKRIIAETLDKSLGNSSELARLEVHLASARTLLMKFRLFLRSIALFSIIDAYLDPKKFETVSLRARTLPNASAGELQEAATALLEKSGELLGDAWFTLNSESEKRRDTMKDQAVKLICEIGDEVELHRDFVSKLNFEFGQLTDRDGRMRIYITP